MVVTVVCIGSSIGGCADTQLHAASAPGPGGPWAAVKLPFGCNNPAPAVANDGSYVLLVCDWSVHKAATFAGPWMTSLPINPTPVPLKVQAHWEDP